MMRNLIFTGIITLFGCAIGNAQILIYSNAFNGGASSVNRKVPVVTTNFAGGINGAWWNILNSSATAYLHQDGTIGTNSTTSLLPFTPENGYVYTLEASVTVPTMTAGKWITMGFAQYNPLLNTATDPRFGSTEVSGNPWTYLTEGSGGCVFWPTRTVNEGGNPNLMPSAGTYTVQLVLDTTGSSWKASEFVNGTQVGTTYTYSGNPTITAMGVGQTTLISSTGVQWNYLTLTATGTRSTNTVNATVSFPGTGFPLNPAFDGLSYEKLSITNSSFFSSNNVPLVKLFSLITSPAVLRMGGATEDTTCWGGLSNTIPITASEVDTFAGFVKALPTNWSVIYGINLYSNTPANAAAEAAYAANDLGPRLLGFEMANEPEFGYSTFSPFLAKWQSLAAAITNTVPGWAVTNGGNGWILVGADGGQGQLTAFTDPFATSESGQVSILTQHYYRGSGGLSSDTMQTMLTADPFLVQLTTNIVAAAAGHCALGARITECASFSSGGTLGVSDVYGAALWSLDFMFTAAVNGCQGINFHGGGRSPYSPIQDNGTSVTGIHPEFYGLKMFSLLPHGNVVPATISPAPGINFTAYGVRQTNGAISVLLNNKEVNTAVSVSVNLGTNAIGAQLITLTSPNLYCTNNYTLGGSAINVDGSWTGGVESVLPTSNGQLTISVPPITAVLLNPIVTRPKIAASLSGRKLTLNWTTNYIRWLLQSNSTGLASSNWFPVPGSTNISQTQITIQPGQSNVFYRLVIP